MFEPFKGIKPTHWKTMIHKDGSEKAVENFVFLAMDEIYEAAQHDTKKPTVKINNGENGKRNIEILYFHNRCKALLAADRFAKSIALNSGEYIQKGYRLSPDFFRTIFLQFVIAGCRAKNDFSPIDDVKEIFKNLSWDYEKSENQKSDRINTIVPCIHTVVDSDNVEFPIVLILVDKFPAGCTVTSSTGKEFDVSTREENGEYRLIGRGRFGEFRDYIFTEFMMRKMRLKDG